MYEPKSFVNRPGRLTVIAAMEGERWQRQSNGKLAEVWVLRCCFSGGRKKKRLPLCSPRNPGIAGDTMFVLGQGLLSGVCSVWPVCPASTCQGRCGHC